MTLDLTLLPLHRVNGQEAASIPGLFAASPPRKVARGREQDRLVAYLFLTGNVSFSSAEYSRIVADAVHVFYQSSGALTSALRATTESVNRALLEHNLTTSGRGQYAVGWLTLAALREAHCTLLLSGPMHVYHLSASGTRHMYEPVLSGKGLGLNESANVHYSQAMLQASDQLLLCAKVPSAWDSTLNDAAPASLNATRRRLTTLTGDDLNAVLIQATEGAGASTLLPSVTESKEERTSQRTPHLQRTPSGPPQTLQHGFDRASTDSAPPLDPSAQGDAVGLPRVAEADPTPEEDSAGTPPTMDSFPAHIVQPSAYAIPPQHEENTPGSDPVIARSTTPRGFPTSIPRARPQDSIPEPPAEEKVPHKIEEEIPPKTGRKRRRPEAPRDPSERTRQAARVLAGGIRSIRRGNERVSEGLRRFLPRLLPANEAGNSPVLSNSIMFFIAILAPLIVVTIASVMYLRFGRSIQYETYINQANQVRTQAQSLTEPVERRRAWENVLLNVERAESVRKTSETIELRNEAEAQRDTLLGIMRLQFSPAFSANTGIDISRMAASETDLFLLNAANGEVERAQFTSGRGFQIDNTFDCAPGVYGGYTVGPLVDILAMPFLNSINATVLGIDAGGNLLYCAPGQVAQAIPLPPPDTNWGRVTAFILDAGNLYVLDAPARAVWVYTGKDGTFIDRPYFFFGGQTPEKQDVIDLLVTGDELYMLHADGHLSNCSYSRIETVPTHCEDPITLTNPFPAYQDMDLFGTAHITQIASSAPPDTSLLLLSADDQSVLRITPRSFELQNQLRPSTVTSAGPVPPGPAGAMAVGPNHVLYLAIDGQVYFATGMP